MSLIENSECTGSCDKCYPQDTIPVSRKDLESIMKMSVCDDVREIIGKYLNVAA